jgi:EmrB/QacA subfamily drug resistance transporter
MAGVTGADKATDVGVAQAAVPEAAAAPASGPPQAGRRSAWLLVVCCVAQFMVILDLSIVNVALPSIQDTLNFSTSALQWVIDAYAITFAGFLMLGGRAADHFGQRRVFVIALAVFALASLAGGLAPTSLTLVIARGAQGLGGALMAASSLAIITSSFPPGPQLHRAIGIWGAMNGLGGAAGVLFGGIITETISWRWVLLINPPIGIVTALIAFAVVVDRKREHGAPRFDLPGALTLTIGQIVLVYGIVETGIASWHSATALVPIFIGLVLLAAFTYIEARVVEAPLIPFKEITRPLGIANTIVVLFSAALFPMWYVGSLYLQQVLGLSPLHTGLTFLPMALTIMLCARRAGKLVSKYGVRPVLGGGLVMMAAGMLLFARIHDSGSSVTYILIPGILTAAGIGFSIVPSTIAATQGAKPGQSGLASGLVNTSRQVGGGLGLAILITLATEFTTHQIGANHPVPQSLTDGFRLAYFICAGLVIAAAAMTFALVPRTDGAATARPLRIGLVVLVAIVGVLAIDLGVGGTHGAPIGAYKTADSFRFVSAPGLHPPQLRATTQTATGKLAPGYIFMANFYDLNHPPLSGQSGPLILDNHLQPVWFQPVPTNVVASNLSLQTYQGQPVLAWWQGVVTNTGATDSGEYVIADQHYRTIARLRGVDGWILTLHSLTIQGNDAWVTANKDMPYNLSRYGGAYNGAITDSAVQEYDLRTGKLVRSWDALDHIPLSQSYSTLPSNGFPWDAYHVNSIVLPGDGTFVVSMRNTWAAYKVNIATGRIVWTLGGRNSSFKFAGGASFTWQHDVTVYPGTSFVTMFDDHCCQISSGGTYVAPTAPSRGLVLKLDLGKRVASLVGQYGLDENLASDYMGSLEPLPNGNELMGWGSTPLLTEYDSSGNKLLRAELPGSDLSYRARLEPWAGQPLYPPAGAARVSGGHTTVYASWNGATAVTAWRVLGGASVGTLRPLATSVRSGFETAIPVASGDREFEVQALDGRGRPIGTSRVFTASG